jgi:hypothetical protein
MFTYLLLGIAVGIIAESVYINIISPIIQMHIELHKIKVTDTATAYALNTERNTYRFYKEYPEARPEPEFKENCNAIGFSIDSDDEEDEGQFEDTMGFR